MHTPYAGLSATCGAGWTVVGRWSSNLPHSSALEERRSSGTIRTPVLRHRHVRCGAAIPTAGERVCDGLMVLCVMEVEVGKLERPRNERHPKFSAARTPAHVLHTAASQRAAKRHPHRADYIYIFPICSFSFFNASKQQFSTLLAEFQLYAPANLFSRFQADCLAPLDQH